MLHKSSLPEFRTLLVIHVALLTLGAACGIAFGPFKNADAWLALLTGMLLVAAMAVQNAVHRSYLSSAPPSTLMTGTTTQIMLDVVDLLRGEPSKDSVQIKSRLATMSGSVIAFAFGCGCAAFLYILAGIRFFALPPFVGVATLFIRGEDNFTARPHPTK
jgi:uncharacterized membrane protein YoaK (UPF0700 family)